MSREIKVIIAEVLYNRLISEEYPDDVAEMVFAPNQFTGIKGWYYNGNRGDEEAYDVIEEVFTEENPSHDAIAFYNPDYSCYEGIYWFEYSGDVDFLFEYGEILWGEYWRVRFFK